MSNSTPLDPIRIILVDDHLVVRAGLKALLAGVPDIRIVGEAANGRDALALIDRVAPDVAVLDLDMPVMDGLTALRSLIAAHSPTHVLILTMHDGAEYLAALLEAGAAGYLVKSAADRELVDAIRAVASGETYVQPTAGRALAERVMRQAEHRDERMQYESLSEREREVLVLVAEGHSASTIGERLVISPKTVETYKQRVSEKLGLHHRSDYVRFCLGLDLLHAHL
ncbi:MAG TPA: response regulator transcription factor [Gemmatimonadaceae bacterium]|nr:response regulator transcription factor [Gemmatimonadaceae bacterium]